MHDERRLTVRLPGPVADWLTAAKDAEGSTINFEIIRSVRERMARSQATGVQFGDPSPAADQSTARQGGAVTHGR